jgi:uncharacterized protein (DUF885 family)
MYKVKFSLRLLLIFISIILLVSCAPQLPGVEKEPDTLEGLLDGLDELEPIEFMAEAFRRLILRSPETVTDIGLASLYGVRNVELDSYDQAELLLTQSFEASLLELAEDIDQDKLTEDVRLDLRIFIWYLQGRVALHPYPWFPFPLLNTKGFLTDQYVYLLMVQQPLQDETDVEDYLSRLEAIGGQVDGIIAFLEGQRAAGIRIPYDVYTEVMEEMGAHRWQVGSKTPFIKVLAVRLQNMTGVSEEQRQAYYDRGIEIANRVIIPAFEHLMDALYKMAENTTISPSFVEQPEGTPYYQVLLNKITTLERTPDQWYTFGLVEVARLGEEVRLAAAEAGYDPNLSLHEIFREVTVDRNYALGLDIFVTLRSLLIDIEAAMDGAFENDIENDLVMVPVFEGGFYEPAALDGSRQAAFYAGFTGRAAHFGMPTQVYHETFPGRHFQASVMQSLDLPLFRKALHFPVYDEGWALYAERLAFEMGMYADDPNTNLGRLQHELLAAAQIVVDTGIHAFGWDSQEAARYLVEAVGIDRSEANDLVLLLVAQPGQSLAAYAGYAFIRDLREETEDTLGVDFDLKAFHTAVLSSGSLPLSLLAEQVRVEMGF